MREMRNDRDKLAVSFRCYLLTERTMITLMLYDYTSPKKENKTSNERTETYLSIVKRMCYL